MKKEEKTLIIVLVVITLIVIGIVMIVNNNKKGNAENKNAVQSQENRADEFVQNQADGSRVNVSETLLKTKKLDGLEITNIQLREIGDITTLLADVENKSGNATKDKMVKVEILDKAGKTIVTLKGLIDAMPAGGKVQLNMAVTADVANAYDFKISNQ